MNKKQKLGVMVGVLATIGLATWAYARFRVDPEVARVQKLGSDLVASKGDRDQWKNYREALDKLPAEKRKQASEGMREAFSKQQSQEMKRFFALPAKQRIAYLDKQIAEMEKRRKEWAAQAKSAPAGKSSSGSASNASAKNAGSNANASTKNGGGQQQGRPPMTAEQRDQRRKQRLDSTSPEGRAERAEFRSQLNNRRQQLGLPPMTGRGR